MGEMAAQKTFAPTDHLPEKRAHQVNLKLTDSEHDELERAAAKAGVTPLNLVRGLVREGLKRLRRRR